MYLCKQGANLEGCGNYAETILSTIQEIIILAVLLKFVNTKPAKKSFQKPFGTDQYS